MYIRRDTNIMIIPMLTYYEKSIQCHLNVHGRQMDVETTLYVHWTSTSLKILWKVNTVSFERSRMSNRRWNKVVCLLNLYKSQHTMKSQYSVIWTFIDVSWTLKQRCMFIELVQVSTYYEKSIQCHLKDYGRWNNVVCLLN